jgi:hypothetical protein
MMMKWQARLLILAALLPLTAQAQGVRDAAGNVIIRDDVAASRGMDPRKPIFTLSVDGNGNYVAPGGGSSGGNAATTSNATDGQATSATNQQNVTYNYLYNGSTWDRARGTGGAANVLVGGTLPAFATPPAVTQGAGSVNPGAGSIWGVAETGTGNGLAGISPNTSAALEASRVIKSSAGNLYGLNVTATAAGYIMIFDATAAPADGAVTPKWVMPLAAGSGFSGPPSGTPIAMSFSTGIVAVYSSTGPFTKTASATAFISGSAR